MIFNNPLENYGSMTPLPCGWLVLTNQPSWSNDIEFPGWCRWRRGVLQFLSKWRFDFELISTPPGSTLSGICWQVVIESAPSWSQKIMWEEQRYLEITGGAALRVADPVIAHIGIFSYPMWTTKSSFKNVQQWYICENLWPSTSQYNSSSLFSIYPTRLL